VGWTYAETQIPQTETVGPFLKNPNLHRIVHSMKQKSVPEDPDPRFILRPSARESFRSSSFILLLLAGLTLSATATFGQNVTVNPGAGSYATLKEAFDAINAGTHTGTVTVSVDASTTETATAVLNASGTGSASYTSVTITPSVPATVTGSIVGAIIKLNGADNVTIDGRIAGTGRNLTVSNTNASAATAAIWLASVGAGNGASNNIIRNLEIACGADQQATTSSTFGIIQSGTAISVTSADGNDNDNNQFIFNRIIKARYGIVSRGVTSNNNLNAVITDNIIGPAAFGADQVGVAGIYMLADTGALISRNTIQNVGVLAANAAGGADRFGIAIGAVSWEVTNSTTITSGDYTVTKNVIHDIVDEKTFSVVGIRLGTTRSGSATNNLVANNFIYNIRANGTSPDQVCGIGYANGHTDKIVFNSISITGDLDPAAATSASTYGNAIRISQANGSNNTNLTLMDNSIYLDVNSNTATVHYYAITANSAAYVFGTGGLNYNNYFINAGNAQLRTGGLATTGTGGAATTEFATLANWKTSFVPAQDANSIQADPLYLSNTSNLHIAGGSPNVGAGIAAGGITDDIDNQLRVAAPDIGADEPAGVTPPANDISATGIITPATGSILAIGAVITPQASFMNVGTAAQTGVMVQFTITGPGGYNYSDTQTIATINAGESVTVTFAAAPAFTTTGTYSTTVAVITPDANSANDQVTGSFQVISPLSGSFDVPGDFPSLTNPGGIFQALNGGGASGNITINIAADLTAETGTHALNELGVTVLIRPSGVPPGPGAAPSGIRQISGTSTGSALIKLNGADNVTIDGSVSGGTDRSMSITNNNAGGATVIWIASANASNGANNNTVRNCILSGTTGLGGTVAGVLSGSGTTFGSPAEAPNSNNTIQNNLINRVQNAAFLSGHATLLDQNWVVTGNTFGSTVVAEKLGFRGMLIGGAQNMSVTNNTIMGVSSLTTTVSTMSGIQVSAITLNGVISGNIITDVKQNDPAGWGSNGIFLTGTSTTSNLTIENNFISDVASRGFNDVTAFDNGYGIMINSGAGYKLYHNSVNVATNQVAADSITAAVNIADAVTTAGGIDLRNNILSDPQTVGTRYAVLNSSTAGAAIFAFIDYNLYYAPNAGGHVGRQGGTDRTTLAGWQLATGQDANSLSGNALFDSPTDLHITCTSPAEDEGFGGLSVIDIDGQTRSATAPDIGADEITAPVATGAVSRLTHTGVGMDFDIFLPLSGPITSESRNGGGNYKIIFTFASPVTVSGAALSLGTGSAGAPLGSGTNTITVNLTGVTDFQRITVKLLCVDDGAGASGDVAVSLNMLIGDATGNSNVNASDIGFTKSQSGAPVGLGNFFADYNLSSPTINASDIGQAKSKSGNALPP
jgi:hypothetical protein